jgi:two-component sensor histidine kinase
VESGGPKVGSPLRKGYGHVVFEQMVAQQLGGEVHIDYRPEGLRWTLSIPLRSLIAEVPERFDG